MAVAFGLVSDLHMHNWSAFSKLDEEGANSRLKILIRELLAAARTVSLGGGKALVVAGDVFHVRGSVAPSVLNAVRDAIAYITDPEGAALTVYILAGNHDIEGKTSTRMGSAVTALEDSYAICASGGPHQFTCGHGAAYVTLFPWVENLGELKAQLEAGVKTGYAVIHAPVNGVIKGIPETGLDPAYLASLGYKGVFSGHYHNHKAFPGNVYSIGAIAHHTWSDVGSKAGYMLVHDDGEIEFRSSGAPSFVEVGSELSEVEMLDACDGNYVKARVQSSSLKDIEEVRFALEQAGALGVTVIPEAAPKAGSREATSVTKGMTLEASVAAYVDASNYANKDDVKSKVLEAINSVRTV